MHLYDSIKNDNIIFICCLREWFSKKNNTNNNKRKMKATLSASLEFCWNFSCPSQCFSDKHIFSLSEMVMQWRLIWKNRFNGWWWSKLERYLLFSFTYLLHRATPLCVKILKHFAGTFHWAQTSYLWRV